MSPALQTLSASERDFIWRSVEGDCRVDGRARMDLRQYTFETGLLPQANGSARVRLAFDGEPDAADVVAAIKVEIGEPLSDRPDEGRVVCHVEW